MYGWDADNAHYVCADAVSVSIKRQNRIVDKLDDENQDLAFGLRNGIAFDKKAHYHRTSNIMVSSLLMSRNAKTVKRSDTKLKYIFLPNCIEKISFKSFYKNSL